MPVRLKEHCFIRPNAPARVRREKKKVVKDPCPNHEYRSRANRMGQTAEFCRLCINQHEMAERWKNIRKAFMTIRSSTRRRSAAVKAPAISAARSDWKLSINISLSPAAPPEDVRVSSA